MRRLDDLNDREAALVAAGFWIILAVAIGILAGLAWSAL